MRHDYYECDLCGKTDEHEDLKMFTYDVSRKEKYIITPVSSDDESEATTICIDCIKRIKSTEIGPLL